MGLDMYLYKRKYDQIAYWRKANAIHKWFEEHIADGEIENCQDYVVTKKDLIALKNDCERVLNSCKIVDGKVKNGEKLVNGMWEPIYQEGKVIEDPSIAQEILPTQSGFFFGPTNYDQYYIEDLKETVEQIDKVLAETDFHKEEIVYHAWW